MKAFVIQLMLAPVAFLIPWLIPVTQKQWLRALWVGTAWTASLIVMLKLWSGPGFAAFAGLGLFALATTRIKLVS